MRLPCPRTLKLKDSVPGLFLAPHNPSFAEILSEPALAGKTAAGPHRRILVLMPASFPFGEPPKPLRSVGETTGSGGRVLTHWSQ